MAIKLADTLAPMSEFPAAMAKHIGFSDGATLQEKFDNKELGGGDSSVTLTQQEYEALTEEQKLDGLYYTYDTKRIYKNGVQYGASEPIPLTMAEYQALKEAGAIDEQQEYLIEANTEGVLLGAEDIGYNNAVSNLPCTTVQGAIDKIAEISGNVYSTEETICGTWIDGKPIYRKCFSGSWTVPSSTWSDIVTVPNIKQIIRTEIIGDNRIWSGYWEIANSKVRFYTPNGTTFKLCILEYTKTTD